MSTGASRLPLVIILSAGVACAPVVLAQTVIPTYHESRYQAFIDEIENIHEQIKSLSEVVGTVRSQIQLLNKVSQGIRDLNDVVKESVQGIAGTIADATGMKDVLKTLSAMQNLSDDVRSLIRDAEELPVEAKRQLAEIGLAEADLKKYLESGIINDTFNQLGVDGWKAVAKNPWTALKNGSFGMAIERSEAYLDPDSRGQLWGEYVSGLSKDEREQMGVMLGPSYAFFLAGKWSDDMGKRAKTATAYRDVINKAAEAVTPASETASDNAKKAVLQDQATAHAAAAVITKAKGAGRIEEERAAAVINAAEMERARLIRDMDSEDRFEADAKAMATQP